jgi:hypothetical protein
MDERLEQSFQMTKSRMEYLKKITGYNTDGSGHFFVTVFAGSILPKI